MSAALPGTGSGTLDLSGTGPRDPDQLLAGYRAARSQSALFDIRSGQPGRSIGYDEFIDADGHVRPAWQPLAEAIGERGQAGLDQLRAEVRALVDNDGITYGRLPEHPPAEPIDADRGARLVRSAWELDAIPLLVSATDWEVLESGLMQRSRLLDAVLTDLYGERRAITSGVLPAELLFAHPGYLRAAHGITIPGRHQLFLHGCDVSRASDGTFLVNADWTQAPSGAGYALADRRVVARTIPDLYERYAPRATSPFAQALRLSLIEAAPEAAEDPVVVVLSPGSSSETAFDQAYLASLLGFPLVESADLVVRDGKLWMRSLGTFKRVDVVLRRVDADYTDPLDLRPDSRLGVVGLVEAQRRDAVTVVNSLGSGILESPGLARFLPELATALLGETPALPSAPMYWGGIRSERSHLFTNVSTLLIRSTVGADPIVGPMLSARQRATLVARINAAPWQFVGQELPQFAAAPSARYGGGLGVDNVGMRLFTVSQRGGHTPMIGGLGYILAPGADGYSLKTVAAKDVWVQPLTRAAAVTPTPVDLPAVSGTEAISSPRVLSDLFWTGRYAERAESMARLLTVTRERYHEYRHRQFLDGSACVPVLLTALGVVTGGGSEGEVAAPDGVVGAGSSAAGFALTTEPDGAVGAGSSAAGFALTTEPDDSDLIAVAPTTLWSLTADRDRPGSLAQSVERLGMTARAVRDQMSNDIWKVLAGVDRAVLSRSARPPESLVRADTLMAAAHEQTLSGMLALAGVAGESMVRDVGWLTMDSGKRIERGLWVSGLLSATITAARSPGAEQTVTEAILIACESSVIYRRRNLGQISTAALTELLLFDAQNPRSLIFQLEQLRANLRAMPGASGSSRPERLVDEIMTRLRRVAPEDLEQVDDDGRRAELAELLDTVHAGLRELSNVITDTHLSLPGAPQPLWGPNQLRVLP